MKGRRKQCPGSYECSNTAGMPLKKYENNPNVDENFVCGGCKFYRTKTEALFEHLEEMIESEEIIINSKLHFGHISEGVIEGFDLSGFNDSPVSINYPDGISNKSWIALKALISAQNTARSEKDGD